MDLLAWGRTAHLWQTGIFKPGLKQILAPDLFFAPQHPQLDLLDTA